MTETSNRSYSASVDVIVPCYRYGRFLRQCVQSVLAQSIEELRVLIIDDASPDDSGEVGASLAEEDSRITFIRHPINKGHIATYNEGIEWARSDYLLLLSADDYLLPGALARATELMDQYPDVGFTFGKAIDVIANGNTTETLANKAVDSLLNAHPWRILIGNEFFDLIERMNSVNVVRTPTAIVRTQLQKRVGGYREELPHSGDFEMWMRLAAHASVGVLSAYQAAYRFHGSNMQMSYYHSRFLPDLEQRKAAVDCVASTCRSVLANGEGLHAKLLKPLAKEAVKSATNAFGEGDADLTDRLCAFAVSTDPQIFWTIDWILLASRRQIGTNLWRILKGLKRRIWCLLS